MSCYLDTGMKETCFGCEACVQACGFGAMRMAEDAEGFRYPVIDESACIRCMKCRSVCPYDNPAPLNEGNELTFGGYAADGDLRHASTSGGLFSVLAETWLDIAGGTAYGAVAEGLDVSHRSVQDAEGLPCFRKSKYAQSAIGSSFAQIKGSLRAGSPVLFSGTPCQVAGLRAYLGDGPWPRLLTIEVICEGIPTPHYIRSYRDYLQGRKGCAVTSLDYRSKGKAKWDFQIMETSFEDGSSVSIDRWFNPFWSIWLDHLMSRPSCYQCPFAQADRGADITLGDLWGVHIYCPELYGSNGGSSLAICNTPLGRDVLEASLDRIVGHELSFDEAVRYQSPLRGPIGGNDRRDEFMKDILRLDYRSLNRKWAKPPTPKLLFDKYIWGNRQKVAAWGVARRLGRS